MWMPLVSTALAMGGSLINAHSQHRTNQKQIDLARDEMRFQKDMSNTAHQREVSDMLAAGRNPALTDGQGGASTPGGAGADLTAPNIAMPELFAYGATIKSLEQKDEQLAIADKLANADIAKNLTEQDLNRMKKIALQKGMPRAILEGKGADVMTRVIDWLEKNVRSPSLRFNDQYEEMFPGLKNDEPLNLNFGR